MCNEKSKEPEIEPCGTPTVMDGSLYGSGLKTRKVTN